MNLVIFAPIIGYILYVSKDYIYDFYDQYIRPIRLVKDIIDEADTLSKNENKTITDVINYANRTIEKVSDYITEVSLPTILKKSLCKEEILEKLSKVKNIRYLGEMTEELIQCYSLTLGQYMQSFNMIKKHPTSPEFYCASMSYYKEYTKTYFNEIKNKFPEWYKKLSKYVEKDGLETCNFSTILLKEDKKQHIDLSKNSKDSCMKILFYHLYDKEKFTKLESDNQIPYWYWHWYDLKEAGEYISGCDEF